MSFPRYPSYKDSGVEWLGAVPEHWGVGQSRRLFALRNEAALDSDKQLTASQKHGVIYQEDFMQLEDQRVVQVIKGADILKHVEPNDFVISMRSFQGGIEWCKNRGCISSAYVMLIPSKRIHCPFFYYLLKSRSYIQALQATSNLVRDGQALRYENFTQVDLPLIPINEQTAIAAFLNEETEKIDGLVGEQRRLMELLKEKVSSLVLSSIDSVGTRKMRFENAAGIISRPVIQKKSELYTPIGLFNRGRGLFHKNPREMDEMGESDFFWIEEGDLVISGQFAWEGAVALAGKEDTGCVVSHRYPVLRGKPGTALTEYLLALLSTKHGDFLLNENSRGAAGRNRPLNITSLLKEKIPVPDLRTQAKIAQAVHWRNNLFKEISKQIELLKERRNALISAAVTGQIDVRQFAEMQPA
jgi:type I restriction enzyme, S subunit